MTTDATLQRLAALVVKTGVGLGGLSAPDRVLALAVAARCLPTASPASEAQINEALKRCLDGEASFLRTDHVELRRWLVDCGWWRRDGFGHAYERIPPAELQASLCTVAAALDGLDLPAWIAARRYADRAQRDARRGLWSARQQGPAHG